MQRKTISSYGLSAALHVVVFLAGGLLSDLHFTSKLIASGPGIGGGEEGNAVEVGLIGGSELFRLSGASNTSSLPSGSQSDLDRSFYQQNPADDLDAALAEKRKEQRPDVRSTDRPVSPTRDRVYAPGSGTESRSRGNSVLVGRESGSPTPEILAGVGVAEGSGGSTGTGLPGGSEYGRRIQMIFSRNYTPPEGLATSGVQYFVVELRVARSGKIVSISNGRLMSSSILRRTDMPLVNSAVERAIIASDPLPPFPVGLLPGSSEATVELWFKYPK